MAASNKPTAVHYSLIVFVIASIVLGVTTYMYQSEWSKAKKDEEKAKADLQTANTSLRTLDDGIVALKKVLGKMQEQTFDSGNPDNPATVVGDVKRDVSEQGQADAGSTVAETLTKMRQAMETIKAELTAQTAAKLATEQQMLALETRYKNVAEEHQKAYKTSEADKRTVINERDEKLAVKDQEIASLRGQKNQAEVELAQEKDARTKERKQLQDENLRLTLINDKLREELDEVKKESFEVGDGKITRVEYAANLVWINLGDADFLKPRMTFSVYSKDTPGVGRTPADVKGKIEVTRVTQPHLAEAKMIDEDPLRPISPGDIIYTPLWSPGRPEKFAIVGKIDLDNDGRSDRDLFKQELAVRGAEITVEVDDKGERHPDETAQITEATKFLIIATIPDPAAYADVEERETAKKIGQEYKVLTTEARLHGVRIVTLSDFLAYIGYKPKQRLFKPGSGTGYNLKAGGNSTGMDRPHGDTQSSGSVSGSFKKANSVAAPTSSGNTSKLFGGK